MAENPLELSHRGTRWHQPPDTSRLAGSVRGSDVWVADAFCWLLIWLKNDSPIKELSSHGNNKLLNQASHLHVLEI